MMEKKRWVANPRNWNLENIFETIGLKTYGALAKITFVPGFYYKYAHDLNPPTRVRKNILSGLVIAMEGVRLCAYYDFAHDIYNYFR